MAQKERKLADYWRGIDSALGVRLKSVQEYLKHPASGFNAEHYFRNLLVDYLPKKYTIDTGFVVNEKGESSDFIDIIIADNSEIPILCSEPHFKVFAAESVVAAVEITSSPKSIVKRDKNNIEKLEDDLIKIAKVRRIAKFRKYVTTVPVLENGKLELVKTNLEIELCPRSFLITYGDEWKKHDTFYRHLNSALCSARDKGYEVWVNSVLSMSHGMFRVVPYTEFEIHRMASDALLEFLLFINNAISTYHTYQIDINRYRPTAFEGGENNG